MFDGDNNNHGWRCITLAWLERWPETRLAPDGSVELSSTEGASTESRLVDTYGRVKFVGSKTIPDRILDFLMGPECTRVTSQSHKI